MPILCRYVFLFVITYWANVTKAEPQAFHGFKRPCRNTSPECLKLSLQSVLPDFVNGIPALGIAPLDPFEVEKLNLALPGGMTIEVMHGYTKGLRNCIVDSVRKLGGDKYEVEFRCNLTMRGKYRSSGRLLMFTIDGEGDSNIICRNLKTTCTFRLEPTTKADGRQYMQIKDFKSNHAFEGRVSFNMTNLFKGNPDINKAVLHFLNENWRMVADEFGDPFFDYGTMGILNNVKKLLSLVPMNQLEAV